MMTLEPLDLIYGRYSCTIFHINFSICDDVMCNKLQKYILLTAVKAKANICYLQLMPLSTESGCWRYPQMLTLFGGKIVASSDF